MLHDVHAFTDEQVAQLLGHDPHDNPSTLGPYPAAHVQAPDAKVKEVKHAVAVVDEPDTEQDEAPTPHFTHDPELNPYPGKQVIAVVFDEQVFAPVPHELHVLFAAIY